LTFLLFCIYPSDLFTTESTKDAKFKILDIEAMFTIETQSTVGARHAVPLHLSPLSVLRAFAVNNRILRALRVLRG